VVVATALQSRIPLLLFKSLKAQVCVLTCITWFMGVYIMGKSVENPKKFIVSCRINDREMEQLKELAKQSGTNISNLLRRSLLGLTEVEG